MEERKYYKIVNENGIIITLLEEDITEPDRETNGYIQITEEEYNILQDYIFEIHEAYIDEVNRYAAEIVAGKITIEDVHEGFKWQVKAALDELEEGEV